MNESTARAELYDLQASTSSVYFWEVPQKPVAVQIPYDLIDRLEREAVESFRSVTSRGSEIGGLLLGSVASGSPMVVSVAEFQLIECEYARGPLYRLNDADIARFQRAIEERAGKGIGVAGYFRTHTRKGVSLDADDITLLDAHFREPHHIALLVRPFATKASTAGIFLRESGKFSMDPSPREFPFRSSGEARPAAGEAEAKATLAGPAPQAPKPAVRAQIVPIASRREVGSPAPVVEEPPAPPAAPVVAAAPAPVAPPVEEKSKVEDKAKPEKGKAEKAPAKSSAAAPAAKVEKPAAKVEKPTAKEPEKPAVKEPEKPAAKEAEKPVKAAAPTVPAPAVAPVPETPVRDVPEAPAPTAKSGKGLKLVLAALATTVLFVMLFVYPGFLSKSSKTPVTPAQDGSPLQLRVERTNGELLLTWNRESQAIRTASKAVLSINDGEQHENVDMDLAQLRNGSIVYSPQGSDISFKMEVIGQGQDKTTSESVRVLRTRPSAMQDQSQSASANKPNPTAPAAPGKQETPAPAAPVAAAATAEASQQEPSRSVYPTKPFKAESLGQRLRPTQATDLPEAPAVGGTRLASSALPGVNLNTVGPAPIAPPSAPSSPATQPQVPARSGGQIQQAVLITKKDPEYPKLARQTGAKGAVRLAATVGKDGKVKGVKIVSGHPMLQAAAKEAVLQWVYKPTLLNGQPVESDIEVVLNFVGDR